MLERTSAISAGDHEPRHTEDRSVLEMHGGMYVNMTEFASIFHKIEKSDTVKVHTTEEGVFVEPLSTDNKED